MIPLKLVERLPVISAGLCRLDGAKPYFPQCYLPRAGDQSKFRDPNYDLLQLALRVAEPDESVQLYGFIFSMRGNEVAYMGCRTRVIANRHGLLVTERRGNIGFNTLNLAPVGHQVPGADREFYRRLEDMAELAWQLYHRYRVLKDLQVKDLPFIRPASLPGLRRSGTL